MPFDSSRKANMASVLFPVVKPELLEEFLFVWDLYFVLEDTVEDEKWPGKLKSMKFSFFVSFNLIFIAEWETRDGTFVALGSKMYQEWNWHTGP